MNVGLQKTTLVNYPRRVAAAVFLPGCNLRCPYCYNGELVCASVSEGPVRKCSQPGANDYVPIEAVYEHIEKRKSVLQGLVISGGEALLSPVLPELILRARKVGLAVKLDTNGLLPDALSALLHDQVLCPDMIALDIKTAPSRYNELKFYPPLGTTSTAQQPETALWLQQQIYVLFLKSSLPMLHGFLLHFYREIVLIQHGMQFVHTHRLKLKPLSGLLKRKFPIAVYDRGASTS